VALERPLLDMMLVIGLLHPIIPKQVGR
jgi:hypothetical protein